jgi:phospholipase/carboxylesterase
MTAFAEPVTVWSGSDDPDAPLVVLLHGRGSNEADIIGLADHLPDGPAYAAVRAPIAEGGGYAWFANRGIGRPVAESPTDTMAWFRTWLDEVAPDGRPVVLVGFSGGAAFAGGLLLADPARYTGAVILYGTLPFDAGVPTTPNRLDGATVLVVHGDQIAEHRAEPHPARERNAQHGGRQINERIDHHRDISPCLAAGSRHGASRCMNSDTCRDS